MQEEKPKALKGAAEFISMQRSMGWGELKCKGAGGQLQHAWLPYAVTHCDLTQLLLSPILSVLI